MTSAPASASNRPQSGPAHSDDRSTTTRPESERGGAEPRAVTPTGRAANGSGAIVLVRGASGRAPTGRPSKAARASRSPTARSRTAAAITDQVASVAGLGSAVAPIVPASSSSHAGTSSTSLTRASETASQPSRPASSRVAPPQLVVPCRVSPASAARSVNKANGSTRTSVPMWAVVRANRSATVVQAGRQLGRRSERSGARVARQGHGPAAGPCDGEVTARSHVCRSSYRTLPSRPSRCCGSTGPTSLTSSRRQCGDATSAGPTARSWS